MIEKLIIISTFMAATVIIYTACWYVEISEVKEETHKGPSMIIYSDNDQILYGDVDRNISKNRRNDDEYEFVEECATTEPIKIITENLFVD